MPIIRLISWADDAAAKAAALKRGDASLKSGKFTIDNTPILKTSSVVGELARLNPAALIFDLDKLPSHSREIAMALRSSKSACHIPILFAGGLPEKVARARIDFPNITCSSWPEAPSTLTTLLQHPPEAVSRLPAREYSATPLAQKLGIRDTGKSMHVTLIGAPDAFEESLGDLPETVFFLNRLTPATQLALCFLRSAADLTAALDLLTLRLPQSASAWIAYPKRKGHSSSQLGEDLIRNAALAVGLVDYKICSIDDAWSAIKFARRRP